MEGFCMKNKQLLLAIAMVELLGMPLMAFSSSNNWENVAPVVAQQSNDVDQKCDERDEKCLEAKLLAEKKAREDSKKQTRIAAFFASVGAIVLGSIMLTYMVSKPYEAKVTMPLASVSSGGPKIDMPLASAPSGGPKVDMPLPGSLTAPLGDNLKPVENDVLVNKQLNNERYQKMFLGEMIAEHPKKTIAGTLFTLVRSPIGPLMLLYTAGQVYKENRE